MKYIVFSVICSLFVFSCTSKSETTCSKDTVCIETITKRDQVVFYAINKKFYKVSIDFDVTQQNMESDTVFPESYVLRGHEKKFLFSLGIGRDEWKYNYNYNWARGDMGAEHDDEYTYRLPYEDGESFRISQTCDGNFTHFGSSMYAIDFEMPVGTAIYSAREGIVVDTKEDSDKGGDDKKYEDLANHVFIEHADGTIGEYYHLKKGGVTVQNGQEVQKGEIIGYSGNTGYTRGPHLHFIIRSAYDGKTSLSHPARFSTPSGIVSCPEKNTYLEAL